MAETRLKPMKHDVQLCAEAYRIVVGIPPYDHPSNENRGPNSPLSESIDRVFTPLTRHLAREIVDAEQWELLNG